MKYINYCNGGYQPKEEPKERPKPPTSGSSIVYGRSRDLERLENFLKQKQYELQVEKSDYNKGIINGLKLAILILKNE